MSKHNHHQAAAKNYEAAAHHFENAHLAHLSGDDQESANQAQMGQGHAILAQLHQENAAMEYAKAHCARHPVPMIRVLAPLL